ncbi:RcpC/CpaB family pilus assembly protein [Streptomyces sp. NPDC058686]|uniref:RcpC/CpaB family pilus assembly protein n=1 Tax=Streptomyces sp. NPDC058686 TaxID=3346599 RepID=UPI00366175C1
MTVSAPVRIADAAAVRLLRPGDRVDVVAAGAGGGAGEAQGSGGQGGRVVAAGARVSSVPGSSGSLGSLGSPEPVDDTAAEGGALVVLSVPRATAARLAAAGATSRLAVTLW